jgi:hypothetical protein
MRAQRRASHVAPSAIASTYACLLGGEIVFLPPSSTPAPRSDADDRTARRPTATLDDDDRAWLEARLALVEYRKLLGYLQDR